MKQRTLALMLHKWYGDTGLDHGEVTAELARRGWGSWKRAAALAVLIPLILVERLLAQLGDDVWYERSPTAKDVAFSTIFSAWAISSIPGSIFLLTWLFGGSFNIVSGVFIATSGLLLLPIWRKA